MVGEGWGKGGGDMRDNNTFLQLGAQQYTLFLSATLGDWETQQCKLDVCF